MTRETNEMWASGDDADDAISLLDLVQVLAEHIRLLLLGPLLCAFVAGVFSFFITPTFISYTTFLIPQQQSASSALLANLGGLAGLASGAAGIKNPNEQYIAFMKSRLLQEAVIDRFHLKKQWKAKNFTDAQAQLESRVNITSGKDGLITVKVEEKNAQLAADLANAYVEELQNVLGKLAVTEAHRRRLFFEKQLQQAKTDLAQAESSLQANGVSASILKTQPQAAVTLLAQLQAQITAQEVKVASMRGFLTEQAPQFKQAITELQALKAQLQRAGGSSAASSGGGYVSRLRDVKYYETLFELFSKQYELARMDELREGGTVIQVLDTAKPPDYPAKPKKSMMVLLAGLSSAFILLLFVFVRRAYRHVLHQGEALQKVQRIVKTLKSNLRFK